MMDTSATEISDEKGGNKMKKEKDPSGLKFKDYFGTTILSVTDAVGACVMTSLFMMYLTDYAGIGKWGAILGTTLLLVARLFDAVNDPLEGWIMDRAKVGKHGKYRPFLLLSILLTSVGLIGLFFLPDGLADSPAVICIWVIGFYLLYDIGTSFYAPNPLYRTMTLDPNARGKLLIGPRMTSMVVGMIGAALITIINGVNSVFQNMHTSFGVTITVLTVVGALISILGLALVKERYHTERDEEDAVKLTDIFGLLKENDALRVRLLDQLFSGFIWTFLFATCTYYIKWAYCTDLSTGIVDTEKFGIMTLISSMMMFLPLIVGTVIAGPLMKKAGSPIKLHKLLIGLQGVSCLLLFVLEVLSVLSLSPIPFFICMFIVATALGADFIPGSTLNMECMDYEIYRNGKDRSALCNACNKFLDKGQNAISAAMVGAILVAIGYEVDSVTDAFLGELTAIPTMLTWFVVVMGLVPGILGMVSWLILRKYPVTDEIRADMNKKLNK